MRMNKIVFLLFFCIVSFTCCAQFSYDKVLVYVKAGVNASNAQSGQVVVIGYNSYNDEIRNMNSSASNIRKTLSTHSEYFDSPSNIPQTSNCLTQSFRMTKYCQKNNTASNSKWTVYSGTKKASSSAWGYDAGGTINYAFSNDKKQMLVWESGKEDRRITYILTDLSNFDPASQTSTSYDFLE